MCTARSHRIVALKALTERLRKRQELRDDQDATRLLSVPVPKPEKARRRKGHSTEHVSKIYSEIKPIGEERGDTAQAVRDVVRLRVSYGLHHSEIERIARSECELPRVEGQGEIAGTVRMSGRAHVVGLDLAAMEACERLLLRGSAPADSYVRKHLVAAAKRAGVKKINPSELRDSVMSRRGSSSWATPKQRRGSRWRRSRRDVGSRWRASARPAG